MGGYVNGICPDANGSYNTIHHYKYSSLSYEQAKDLDDYYKYDFNGALTGIPGEDMFYYKFNEEEHTNCDFFTSINAHGKDFSVVIKPYITNEDATIRDGANIQNQPGVQKRTRDIVRKGVVSQISIDLSMIKATAGYHFEQSDMDIYTQNYWIQNDGSLLYRGCGLRFLLIQPIIILSMMATVPIRVLFMIMTAGRLLIHHNGLL